MKDTMTLTANPREEIAFELVDEKTGVAGMVTEENSVIIYEQNAGTTLMPEVRGFVSAQLAIGFAVLRVVEEAEEYARRCLEA